jgi:glycosyltransferase involved in cell wall biosynthesis
MANVVILQRVVPPYRMPLFRRLWEEFGWTVAFGKNLSAEGIPVEHGAPFLRGYIFRRGPGGIIRVPISKILADLKPDAVIAEGALHLTSTWELVLRREFFGSPKLFFWTIGYNPSATDEPSRPGSRQWIYPTIYRFADGCLTYGADGRDFLLPRLRGKPVFVAQNSVDMNDIRSAEAEAIALPRRGYPELIAVSRLTPAKEYVKLVRAFLILLNSFPSAQLTIVGEGPELESIKSAGAEELGRRIHLIGAIYDENLLAPHMKRADAFVLTGRVGLAINHALGYGLPVICGKRGKTGPRHGSEIMHLHEGITGYQVETSSPEAFAEKLVSLFQTTPNLRAAHDKQIRDYVAEHMSLDRMISGFKEIESHINNLKAKLPHASIQARPS